MRSLAASASVARRRPLRSQAQSLALGMLVGVALTTSCAMTEASAQTGPSASSPVRSTEYGRVLGIDGDVQTFRGIPYAAPPIGQKRWRSPEPPDHWTNDRSATQFGSDCFGVNQLRKGSLAPGVSEDCLYLNVWAPRDALKRNLPVMVWVYGGSFVGGSSAMPFYDGSALARRGVIVVTFNYRTNVFGFFGHPALSREGSHQTSGNYGLLDILSALGWVHRNIENFGGDPRRVTVFGESAGASAIGLLLTSPESRGLFSGAILESPGLLRPLATLQQSEAAGSRVGEDLSQLRAMDPATLMARVAASLPTSRDLSKPRPIGPIIDGWVLPQSDAQAVALGNLAQVPVIIGSNAEEGRIFVAGYPINTVTEYRAYVSAQFGEAAATVERCYPAQSDEDVKPALARLFGDSQFIRGIDAYSAALARRDAPVWRYRFNGNVGPDREPASHGADIPYVFGVLEPDEVGLFTWLKAGPTPADRTLSDQIQARWAAFATHRDPRVLGTPSWQAYKPGGAIMTFGTDVAAVAGRAGAACIPNTTTQ